MCGLTEPKQVRDWEKRPVEFKPYYETLLPENQGRHCCGWPAGKADAKAQMLVEANNKGQDIVICMDKADISSFEGGNNLCSSRQTLACFEGNLGETADRWGGARMGPSERYNAILSRNRKWTNWIIIIIIINIIVIIDVAVIIIIIIKKMLLLLLSSTTSSLSLLQIKERCIH